MATVRLVKEQTECVVMTNSTHPLAVEVILSERFISEYTNAAVRFSKLQEQLELKYRIAQRKAEKKK